MTKRGLILITIFLTAFLLRISMITLAHHGDLNNNISWGTIAYEKGFTDFYEGYNVPGSTKEVKERLPLRENGEVAWPYSAPNQPPLTIEMFALSRMIWLKLRDFIWYMNWTLLIFPSKIVWFWDEKGMDILVKLPSVIADLGLGMLIYKIVKENVKKSGKLALILTCIWLFNPLTWYNSAIWGQTDPIVNFLGLLAIYFLIKKKLPMFGLVFTLSLMFKGSLLVFMPVLLTYIIIRKFSFKEWIKTIVYCFAGVVVVAVWFHPEMDFISWLIRLYKDRILPGEIGYLTANAFNFWWLIDPGKVLDNTVFFGLPARLWGFISSFAGIFLVIKYFFAKPTRSGLFLGLALSSLVTFLFLTRIHERYLYPFFPSATIGLAFAPQFWPVYTLLSLTFLINQYNLFWVPTLDGLRMLLGSVWFTDFLCYLNLGMLLIGFRLLKTRKV